ncbi:MAG: hypothetical protein V4696_05565 [Pseudomonadota bacterium]
MTDHNNQDNAGQSGIDAETEQRNRENETGQQGQTGNETPTESTAGQSGFVGSDSDQSSDYLTKGENEDFQPEDQTDTNAGTSDIETGQPTSQDSTLDDGSDTSR